MSTGLDLYNDLRGQGVRFEARGEHLRVKAPPGALTPERREALRASKAGLLARLRGEDRRDERAIVTFNLAESPGAWPVCIGAQGETVDDVIEGVRRRYGKRLLEARPRNDTGAKR